MSREHIMECWEWIEKNYPDFYRKCEQFEYDDYQDNLKLLNGDLSNLTPEWYKTNLEEKKIHIGEDNPTFLEWGYKEIPYEAFKRFMEYCDEWEGRKNVLLEEYKEYVKELQNKNSRDVD